jgi:hypothetical protein
MRQIIRELRSGRLKAVKRQQAFTLRLGYHREVVVQNRGVHVWGGAVVAVPGPSEKLIVRLGS